MNQLLLMTEVAKRLLFNSHVICGLAGCIWLAILGEWWSIIYGLFAVIAAESILRFVLKPRLILTGSMVDSAERGNTYGLICLGSLFSLYSAIIMTVWCVGVLLFFNLSATHADALPKFLWSYGIATGPWIYMALNELDCDSRIVSIMFAILAQLACFAIGILMFCTPITVGRAIVIFASFMAVGIVIQVILFVQMREDRLS